MKTYQCSRCNNWFSADPNHPGYPDLHRCRADQEVTQFERLVAEVGQEFGMPAEVIGRLLTLETESS